MSFLYPRTVDISRREKNRGVGAQSEYAGALADNESSVIKGLPCSIQVRRSGGRNPVGLPADGSTPSWIIFISKSAAPAPGTIRNGDIVTDDTGLRYQVTADYWDSLGYALSADRLEA